MCLCLCLSVHGSATCYTLHCLLGHPWHLCFITCNHKPACPALHILFLPPLSMPSRPSHIVHFNACCANAVPCMGGKCLLHAHAQVTSVLVDMNGAVGYLKHLLAQCPLLGAKIKVRMAVTIQLNALFSLVSSLHNCPTHSRRAKHF